MILIDANLLLYAYDTSSPFNREARAWLEVAMNGDEQVGLSLTTLLAFLRIVTNPAVFQRALRTEEAVGIATSWLEQPSVTLAQPTNRHWSVLASLAKAGQARGPLLMDAHLAALAVEHGATLYTTDRNFARFPGLRATNPLEGLPPATITSSAATVGRAASPSDE